MWVSTERRTGTLSEFPFDHLHSGTSGFVWFRAWGSLVPLESPHHCPPPSGTGLHLLPYLRWGLMTLVPYFVCLLKSHGKARTALLYGCWISLGGPHRDCGRKCPRFWLKLGSQHLEAPAVLGALCVLLGSVNNDNNNDSHYCVGADTDSSFTLLSTHLIFPTPLWRKCCPYPHWQMRKLRHR